MLIVFSSPYALFESISLKCLIIIDWRPLVTFTAIIIFFDMYSLARKQKWMIRLRLESVQGPNDDMKGLWSMCLALTLSCVIFFSQEQPQSIL